MKAETALLFLKRKTQKKIQCQHETENIFFSLHQRHIKKTDERIYEY